MNDDDEHLKWFSPGVPHIEAVCYECLMRKAKAHFAEFPETPEHTRESCDVCAELYGRVDVMREIMTWPIFKERLKALLDN
jgi:hypothetical protein